MDHHHLRYGAAEVLAAQGQMVHLSWAAALDLLGVSALLVYAVVSRVAATPGESLQGGMVEAYGMTEAAHQIRSNRLPGDGPSPRPGSAGLAAGPEPAPPPLGRPPPAARGER